MTLAKQYQPHEIEPALRDRWLADGTYHFEHGSPRRVYSIDTPPPTVSGNLHLGHVYSYSHADFMARFFRMRGYNVFYPMGFDDNGLPTEKLVEKRERVSAQQVGRKAFIERCLQTSEEMEREYRDLWQRLGLSVDWNYTYRTIDVESQRSAQRSFIDLHRKGLVYRSKAPTIWCPECKTGIAQADLEDRERASEFIELAFTAEDGQALHIATTRPELLAACVAVFVHPGDERYRAWIGRQVRVPLYQQAVPVLSDPAADPEKGTGVVMCCTFGDQADVAWWYGHHLPLIEAIGADGRMLPVADLPGEPGTIAGLPVEAARKEIKAILEQQGLILSRQPVTGMVRVHERCDSVVEYRITSQWFINVLEHKEKFLELGRQVRWHPEHMHARYQAWVENLNWDWCISRQRYHGVPFPAWYCKACGKLLLAGENELPVDPQERPPSRACACGSRAFEPDTDIMDTWATSSLSPYIVTRALKDLPNAEDFAPMDLRPQAHEIIRTWAFYTIVKSWYHDQRLPWRDVLISGWALAGEGMGKMSKSRGGGPMAPMTMIERYSSDALRYWAASTSPGKDSTINEEKMQMGAKLVTKLWNVSRFSEPFIDVKTAPPEESYTPADRWILARCRVTVENATAAFSAYEYALAKSEIEGFFWKELADNYIEMAKQRLYDPQHPAHQGACFALRQVLQTLLKLFAPLLPFVTEAIWQSLFAEDGQSIHQTTWPTPEQIAPRSLQEDLSTGERLVEIATAVRRYKSEHSLSLGSELACLQLVVQDPAWEQRLTEAAADLTSVTRARRIEICHEPDPEFVNLHLENDAMGAAIQA
jgi:valyl-tRNA synthetase